MDKYKPETEIKRSNESQLSSAISSLNCSHGTPECNRWKRKKERMRDRVICTDIYDLQSAICDRSSFDLVSYHCIEQIQMIYLASFTRFLVPTIVDSTDRFHAICSYPSVCVWVWFITARKVQAKKRVNSMHEPRINARESSAYYSLPYYRAIFYSTAILCLICYVYKMQMCNLPCAHTNTHSRVA